MLGLLTEEERRRTMKVLTDLSFGPPRRMTPEQSAAARAALASGRSFQEELVRRAVAELQALSANGGRLQ